VPRADDRARKAGLRLDTEAGAFAVLESGRRAIVPRSTRRSELVHRILSSDPAVMMPTPESHLALTDYERALLVRWVEQGATWKPHWAFIPPARPTPPATNDNRPNASEIDAFVVARLAPQGLAPVARGDPRDAAAARHDGPHRVSRQRWRRSTRSSPTRRPTRTSDVVDRLLATSAYGERMAADWLDIARYADSHGYQDDVMRDMSPWRDWVIEAFNQQHAAWTSSSRGSSRATCCPTADHVSSAWPRRSTAITCRARKAASSRRSIGWNMWPTACRPSVAPSSGSRLDCARCHDHKYDPVLQREYFQLFGFFNSINEAGQAPYSGMPSPTLVVGHAEADAKVAELRARIRALEAQTAIDTAALDAPYAAWLARAKGAPAARRVAPGDLLAHLPLDGSELKMVPEQLSDEERRKRQPKLVLRRFFENRVAGRPPATLGGDRDRIPDTVPGPTGQGQRLVGDSFIDLGRDTGQFERHQPFSFALWFRIDKAGTAGPLVTRSAGVFSGNRGFEVMLHADGRLTAALHHTFPDSSIEIASEQPRGAWRVAAPGVRVRRLEPRGRPPPVPRWPTRVHARRRGQPAAQHPDERQPEAAELDRHAGAAHRQAPR
jgi:hypothetical protein